MDGERLREIREARGETQDEFLAALNSQFQRKYDRPKISRWETGKEKIPADVSGFVQLRQFSYERKDGAKLATIAVVNQKGGVGKTETAVNLSYVLARIGAKTLLVDCDAQGNATLHVGVTSRESERLETRRRMIYDVLSGTASLKDVIRPTPVANLFLAPSSTPLANADIELNGRLDVLKTILATVESEYDFVVLDCSPSLGAVTLNALTAAHQVVVPVQTESYAIVGLAHLTRTIANVRAKANPNLNVLGIIPTMYNPRQSQDRASLEDIQSQVGAKYRVFEPIPRATICAQAAAANAITLQVDPAGAGLATYIEIARLLQGGINGEA